MLTPLVSKVGVDITDQVGESAAWTVQAKVVDLESSIIATRFVLHLDIQVLGSRRVFVEFKNEGRGVARKLLFDRRDAEGRKDTQKRRIVC